MKEHELYIDRILYPVTALGPGERIVIWVEGCEHHCKYCANPELWQKNEAHKLPVKRMRSLLMRLIEDKKTDGLTITGGEPFDQSEALCELLDGLEGKLHDILIYSGYTYSELKRSSRSSELLRRVDVLVDGPYIDDLNRASIALRGSENQKIYYIDPDVKEKYDAYMALGRQIQNFVYDYNILSVGIHHKNDE